MTRTPSPRCRRPSLSLERRACQIFYSEEISDSEGMYVSETSIAKRRGTEQNKGGAGMQRGNDGYDIS